MKNLFTTYPIAKKLKELGFDEPCLGHYVYDSGELHTLHYGTTGSNKQTHSITLAPLWQQAIHWLLNYIQNNKNLYIKVTIFADNSYIVDSIVNNLDYHFVLNSNQDLLNKLLEF